MFLQILTVSCLGILVNGQFVKLDTSSCKNFNDTINNCVTNYSVIGIPRQDARTVQQFFSSIEPSVYCSSENNANFKSLLSCIVTAYRTCAGGKFQTLLATGESYKQAIDEVCRRKDGFNVTCTYNSNSCARTNIERKGLTQPETYTPFSDQKTVYCGYTEIFKTCLEKDTVLSSCPQSQSKKVMLYIIDKLAPPACSTRTSSVLNLSLFIVSVLLSIFKYSY